MPSSYVDACEKITHQVVKFKTCTYTTNSEYSGITLMYDIVIYAHMYKCTEHFPEGQLSNYKAGRGECVFY